MIPFSDTTRQNILAFAATMGITLKANHQGSYGFKIAGRGVLSLTAAHDSDRMLVSLSFAADPWSAGAEERLFALAQSEWAKGRLLRVGLSAENMVFLSVSIEGHEVSPQLLDDCLQQLLSAYAAFM